MAIFQQNIYFHLPMCANSNGFYFFSRCQLPMRIRSNLAFNRLVLTMNETLDLLHVLCV
eukprot:jgi/Botrbrau1/3047/Bobra.0070s0043.1